MAEETKVMQKRQVAVKTPINVILSSSYVREEGLSNYLKTGVCDVHRVNIIGTIVQKEANNSRIVIEDKTGTISLRSFEGEGKFSGVDVGNIVLVIGKPREYANERYVLPEIIKRLENSKWLSLRDKETAKLWEGFKEELKNKESSSGSQDMGKESAYNAEEVISGDSDGILSVIREMDKGEGAAVDEVIKACKKEGADETIMNLLKQGDIFEVRPGRVKILE